MSGNSFGRLFTVTTFGESHGPAMGCIVDGCPPGMALTEADIQADLERRRPGKSRHTTARQEPDQVQILSGVFEGLTTGTPIGLLIENVDQRSRDYSGIKDKFRPGHADYTYQQKYGIRDYRGGGRSSARETTMRVAAGAIARKYLAEREGIVIRGFVSQLGSIKLKASDLDATNDNPFFCADPERLAELEAFMDALREEGDSIGAKISVLARNLPPGLGEPVFDKLEADIAHGLMSINAVKGVEFGEGFDLADLRGSLVHDVIKPIDEWEKNADGTWKRPWPRRSNRAGGIEGGMTNGEPLIVRAVVKPIATIINPLPSVDLTPGELEQAHYERSDITFVPTCGVIAEAMVMLTLADAFLEKFGGDHIDETKRNYQAYVSSLGPKRTSVKA